MRFQLVDRIESITPGERIVTTKALSLAEEYLGDHFPAFPVLPGVLMLEALTQSAAWLARIAQDFTKSAILLRKAQNIRYNHFVAPGDLLRCEVDVISIDDEVAKFKGVGIVGDKTAVSGKLELTCFNVSERNGLSPDRDQAIIAEMKHRFRLIHGPQALEAAGSTDLALNWQD
ncbi:MAG: 3-hydroxyacyl-ACP dehydratase FabZ family protein [Planctomycetota bacterium]